MNTTQQQKRPNPPAPVLEDMSEAPAPTHYTFSCCPAPPEKEASTYYVVDGEVRGPNFLLAIGTAFPVNAYTPGLKADIKTFYLLRVSSDVVSGWLPAEQVFFERSEGAKAAAKQRQAKVA